MKAAKKSASGGPKRGYLDGQMLIAMPSMRDERFSRSVIYVCAHSSEGAMGIIVNQLAANVNFPDLLVQLEVIPAADLIQLPQRAGTVKVLAVSSAVRAQAAPDIDAAGRPDGPGEGSTHRFPQLL